MVELPLSCLAFAIPIALPPYYQAEGKFEKKKSFMKLMKTNLSDWTKLWEQIVEVPEITLKKIPKLLKPVERIGFEQLWKKLDTVDKASSARVNGSEILINWSEVIATVIVIVVTILAV